MTGRTVLRRLCRRMMMVVAGVLATALSIVGLGSAADAATDNPDIDTVASYVYDVDTDNGAVDVTITVEITADKPNQTTSDFVYEYFFEAYGLVIPAGVEDLTITDSAGRALQYEVVDEDQRVQAVTIDFRRNLFYRQTTVIVISYSLLEDRDSETSLVRVNPAYIGLEVWTDPMLEEATVEIVTPLDFVSSNPLIIGNDPGQLGIKRDDDVLRFTANDVDPENFWQVVSLNRPEMLEIRSLNVGGYDVTLKSWPGDNSWAADATESIGITLPALIETIGLDWPLDDYLTITQSFDPALAGYAGWYDTEAHEILVGDNFDDHVMVHEMSHMWFNSELSTDRWITEGLANTYAAETLAAIGEERPKPRTVRSGDTDSIPLVDWSQFESDLEVEEWAYPASWFVMDEILGLVGKEALDKTVAAMHRSEISYVGDSRAEVHDGYTNWRYFLDLLENSSGSDNEQLQKLYFDWILHHTDDPYLERRPAPRELYHALVERGAGWAAPLVVRKHMANWTFDPAEKRMETATTFLDRRDDLNQRLEPLGVELPPLLKESYESASDSDMEQTALAFDETEEAADALLASHDMVGEATGLLQQIGAVGSDFDTTLADSNQALADGDLDEVKANEAELTDHVAGLKRAGLVRAGGAAGVLVLLVGGGFGIRRWRGRSSPSPDDETVDSGATDQSAPEMGTAQDQSVGHW